MGLLTNLFGASPTRERAEPRFTASGSLDNPGVPLTASTFEGGDYGGATGPLVNERTAMAQAAAFRCVSLISGMVACLPLNVYKDTDKDGREEAKNHRLYPFLHVAPTSDGPMSAFVWKEQWSINTLLWGNHFSLIQRDGAGRVAGFVPLLPWNVTVYRAGPRNQYRCIMGDGSVQYVDQEDMIHIPGLGFDGIVGQSRIKVFARESVSLALTLSQQISRVHENAAKPTGMVVLPKGVKTDEIRRVEAWFAANYTGRHNAGKPLFMDAGTTYTSLQMSAEDLNTLALMQYQNQDICRFFGVPPHMIGETSASTAWGTGIEQMTLGFKIYTLEAELQRIEHELNLKLFQNGPFFASFDRNALLAMDQVALASTMQTQIYSGLLTPNEGRRALLRPDMPNGDVLLVNSATVTLANAVKPPKPPPVVVHPPAPAPADPAPAEPEPKPAPKPAKVPAK